MKNTKVTGFIISMSAIVTMTLIGCSESTHVKEEVNVKPDTVNVTPNKVVTPANKDVNVNVKVGNNAPAPAVVHEQTTTHVINVESKPVEQQTQEKQVVINNNITTPSTATTVTKETKTDLATGTTQTTEVKTGSNY